MNGKTTFTLSVGSEAETAAAAALFGAVLPQRIAVGFFGPLGAGKTSFVRACLQSLSSGLRVVSPSYVLEQRYELPKLRISHWDLYRLGTSEFPEDLRECLDEAGVVLIEWPERSEEVVKKLDIQVVLNFVEPNGGSASDTNRRIHFSAHTDSGSGMLTQFAEQLSQKNFSRSE